MFGPSKGQNIPLFERFQRLWSMVDQQNFKPLGVPVDPHLDEPQVQELRNETIVFFQSVLLSNTGYMLREDYREMIELCLLLLGVSPVEGKGSASGTYHFRLPGSYHLARWMAKIIYCFNPLTTISRSSGYKLFVTRYRQPAFRIEHYMQKRAVSRCSG